MRNARARGGGARYDSWMRIALAAVLFVGACSDPGGYGDDGYNDGYCHSDGACDGSTVCARNGLCELPGSLRAVTLRWTINGGPANPTTCTSQPDLSLNFDSNDSFDRFGFEPVPCRAGQFYIDKIPKRYIEAELCDSQGCVYSSIAEDDTAQFDLPL